MVRLTKRPEKIKDISLVNRILKTLKDLKQKNNHEYILARVQSLNLGGSCYPIPVGYTPSKNTIILETYDAKFFQKLRKKLQSKGYK